MPFYYIWVMIKLFFFGTLPLGLKRFFRAISFVWFCFMLTFVIDEYQRASFEAFYLLLLCFGVPMVLSYAISGFFVKKTD